MRYSSSFRLRFGLCEPVPTEKRFLIANTKETTMHVQFGTPSNISRIAEAVPLYGTKEFESPTRSTVAMLDLLIHSEPVFQNAVRALGFPADFVATLEFKVPPPAGKGKASHTDVMLRAGDQALAIEAKWTEPMYETVSHWLGGGDNLLNRRKVLGGWLGLLARNDLQQIAQLPSGNDGSNAFDDCIYQMVHRAASAASAGTKPSVAYFLFHCEGEGNSQTASNLQMCEKLRRLWETIGSPATFPFHIVTFRMKPTQLGQKLLTLGKGRTDTSDAISAALQDDKPLFQFDSPSIETIR